MTAAGTGEGVEVERHSFFNLGSRYWVSRSCLGSFTPVCDPVPLYRRLLGTRALWTGAENLAPTGIPSQDRPASIPSELPRSPLCQWTLKLKIKQTLFKDCKRQLDDVTEESWFSHVQLQEMSVCLLHRAQTVSRAHLTFYSIRTGGTFVWA